MSSIRGRIGRNGQKSYCVQIRHQGQTPQVRTFSKLRDAKAWAAQQEGAYVEGRSFPNRIMQRYTLAHAIDRYIEEILPHHREAVAKAKRLHLHWWRKWLGHVKLADLSSDHIVAQRSILAQTHGPGTVNNYCKNLRVTLRLAVRQWRWLERSPMEVVTPLKESKGRTRFLTIAEKDRLLEACKISLSPHLYALVVLALGTGGRKRELLNLTWDDVNLERRIVMFHETKNGESRSVPLTGLALEVMQAKFVAESFHYTDVFPGINGKRSAYTLWDAWVMARKRAGLKNFRFHDLRHTFASHLAMNGASLLDIAALLGHKQVKMVQRYAHLLDDYKRLVVEKMARAFLA